MAPSLRSSRVSVQSRTALDNWQLHVDQAPDNLRIRSDWSLATLIWLHWLIMGPLLVPKQSVKLQR
jgi:hypothetical protein